MKTTAQKLPQGVIAADLKYPGWDKVASDAGNNGVLTFYLVNFRKGNEGWVLTTLPITGNGRTYGTIVETGSPCRVGRGPHVLQTVQVYVSKARRAALQKYVDLHEKGMADAGQIRDRISSRRAEGQLRRANGERSWRWSV